MRKKIIFVFLIVFFSFNSWSKNNIKIISLAPSFTECLYLLDAADSLIACTTYCKRPIQAKTKLKIGNTINFNVEKIIELKPDLVLAMEFANKISIKKLSAFNIKTQILKSPKNFDEICSHFLQIAEFVNKKEKGSQIISKVKADVENLISKFKEYSKPNIFVQLGINPIFAASKNSFINDMINKANGLNIARDYSNGIFSREKVIEMNPDFIFIVSMGDFDKNEQIIWKKYNFMNASKNNNIFVLDSYIMCSPTPITFYKMLEKIAYIIHGKNKNVS